MDLAKSFNGLTERSQCLIGNIVSGSVLDRWYMESIVQRMWRCNVKMSEIKGTIFLFYFENGDDCYRVLRDTPWTIQGCLLILIPLFSRNIPSKLPLCYSPFWVQVHGIPLHLLTEDNVFKIGHYLGEYLYVDKSVWSRFLRIRVRMDINNPLVTGFSLNGIWIQFKYEKLGLFCYKCGRIGHPHFTCKFPPGNERYGPWLRVETLSNHVNDWSRSTGSIRMENSMTILKNPSAGFTLICTPKRLIWPTFEARKHQDSLGITPTKNMWARLMINGVDSTIMIVTCAVILGRAADANEVVGYGWLSLMMIAYFFYLVLKFNAMIQQCRFFQQLNGTGGNSIEYNPVTQLKDLFILLLFCVTFLVSF